jgi:hypothetical protein
MIFKRQLDIMWTCIQLTSSLLGTNAFPQKISIKDFFIHPSIVSLSSIPRALPSSHERPPIDLATTSQCF